MKPRRILTTSIIASTALATTVYLYQSNLLPYKKSPNRQYYRKMAPQQLLNCPIPGEIIQHDFRQKMDQNQLKLSNVNYVEKEKSRIRVIQWNIERGYKLQEIIEELGRVDADILCLQELDIGCERSDFRDVGKEIASALKLNYAFVCEFDEIYSELRSASAQGGGVHGNGIMSKFDFKEVHAVMHQHDPVNWEDPSHPYAKLEPRKGQRATIAATIIIPDKFQDSKQQQEEQLVMVYSAHLELFCGILSRVHQFSEILRDAKQWIEKGVSRQIIGGDLNTMGHGYARLSPYYCMDKMRYLTLGQSEAKWWDQNVFSEKVESGQKYNKKLVELGLSEQVAQDALNPGFWDPWDVDEESTMDIFCFYNTFHLMKGKLDWLLLRGDLAVLKKELGNHDYSASDHKYLLAELTIHNKFVGEEQTVLV